MHVKYGCPSLAQSKLAMAAQWELEQVIEPMAHMCSQLTSLWELEIGHGRTTDTTEIGKSRNQGFSPPWSVNS